MIDLGLVRIGRLLQQAPPPAWKAIHVAGTNGKGSVCAYLSAMLHARGVPGGRFTSPHLVDRWDCVVVDERVVSESVFHDAEQAVQRRDRAHNIQATEFELLAATAFEVWGTTWPEEETKEQESGKTDGEKSKGSAVCVVEAGLGGVGDATTAMLASRAVTVITRIGLDHQALLGSTTAAIAANKAGIMRAGVPCVIDPANRDDAPVRAALEAHAAQVGAPVVYPDPATLLPADRDGKSLGLEPHQLTNLACAYAAFRIAMGERGESEKENADEERRAFLEGVVTNVRWPGRLQRVDIGALLPENNDRDSGVPRITALLDGAHNEQSAEVLGAYVDKHLRTGALATSANGTGEITWVLAASHGKDLAAVLKPLLRHGDRVAAVRFGPVDGMPWVKPAVPQTILKQATSTGVSADGQFCADDESLDVEANLIKALQWAVDGNTGGGPIVIAGSLYLVSSTLRLLRAAGAETGLP